MTSAQTCQISGDGSWLTTNDAHLGEAKRHALWLKGNRLDDANADPGNGQRLNDIGDVDLGITLQDASVTDNVITVTFNDGNKSQYPAPSLFDIGAAPKATASHWKKSDLENVEFWFSYDEVLADPEVKRQWLTRIRDYGFALLSGTPVREGMVLDTVKLFGFVRETNYAELFDVRVEANANKLAFTGKALLPHTGNPCREPVPGMQLLHCLQSDVEGGDTILVDGFRLADELKKSDPKAFEILSTYDVPFRYRNDTTVLSARGRMIELDAQGALKSFRYNNRSIAPIDLADEILEDYYAAYAKLSALVRNTDY
jgi:alpha-ketoglutarate-dependent taurine dioxygenase